MILNFIIITNQHYHQVWLTMVLNFLLAIYRTSFYKEVEFLLFNACARASTFTVSSFARHFLTAYLNRMAVTILRFTRNSAE